jgi:hypothetical protein
MMIRISPEACYVYEVIGEATATKMLIQGFLDDIAEAAQVLNLRGFSVYIRDENLNAQKLIFAVGYQTSTSRAEQKSYRQEYEAIGLQDSHYGRVRITVGTDDQAQVRKLDLLIAAGYQSYYERTRRFFPNHAMQYFDAPKEVE